MILSLILYVCAVIINEKTDRDFEEGFGGIYVRTCRKKGKGEMLQIQKCCMISKIKEPKRKLTLRVDY